MPRPTTEMLVVKHISAASKEGMHWRFLKPNQIFLRIAFGSAPWVELGVPCCSHKHTRFQHWVIIRKSESLWLLTAARIPVDNQAIVKSERFHEDLPVGSILLSEAPESVSAELEAI